MSTTRTTRIMRALALATTLALAPFTVTKEGVATTTASCQTELEPGTGTCCIQQRAMCNAGAGDNPGYCYKTSGSCSSGPSPCS